MITLTLYKSLSDRGHMTKNLTSPVDYSGSLRDSSPVTDPVIMIETDNPSAYNYAFIPIFGRYYFIEGMTSVRTGLWELTLHVDPLMTYRSQLLAVSLIVEASTARGADEYLSGTPWVARVKELTDIVNFPQGLPQEGEFILITAGG